MKTESHALFDLLISKGFDVKTFDNKGKEQDNVSDADMFSFNFISHNNNYGSVIILLNSHNELEIFYGDNIGKSMKSDDKKVWWDLLYQLRLFGKKNLKGFKLNDLSKLKYVLKGYNSLKESLFENYYGTKRTSYNPQGNAKIIIKHSKPIEEGDRRYYHINALFVENVEGERFKLPFTKLSGARAMARHVTEGGTPYDAFGNHIVEMVKNINTLGGFIRRSKMFEEDDETREYITAGREYYTSLRKKLKKITNKRGYHTYKEEWDPTAILPEENDINTIRQLFTEKSINSNIEEALPILASLKLPDYKSNKMAEISEFDDWANTISEGTWILPETPDQLKQLRKLLSTEQPVGVDAFDINGKIFDIIGNDNLYDELYQLSQKNPKADARPVIRDWLKNTLPKLRVMKNLEQNEDINKELDADTETQLNASYNKILDKKISESMFDDFKSLINRISKT